jgi:MFS transporter, NNP family, nitrate/nitrite transporter
VCWLHFYVSAFCWVLAAALVTSFATKLGFGSNAKAMIVGSSAIGTALIRLIVGPVAERHGMKRVGIGLLVLSAGALIWGSRAHSFAEFLAVGALLGIAGASFGIALPLAGKAFDRAHQGIVLGIVGSGSGGTVTSVLVAPWLAHHFGWRTTFLIALIPLSLTLVLFAAFAQDDRKPSVARVDPAIRVASGTTPNSVRPRYRDLPSETRTYAFLYMLTFGGFLGLTTYLPVYLKDRFALTPVAAGVFAAGCGILGALARPLGGAIADRVGARPTLFVVFSLAATMCLALAASPSLPLTISCATVLLAFLGAGNGAVFQLVGARLAHSAGTATALVGAAGGLGGFLIPVLLAALTTSNGAALFGFAFLALAMSVGTYIVRARSGHRIPLASVAEALIPGNAG